MDGYLSTPRVTRAADVIMDQIERLILEGKVRPGQKLPSERSLAEEFDVSRPTVREAIQKLEARGLIQRRHGGGTFVAEHVGSTFIDPMMAMIQRSPDGTFDILELRFALESVAAGLQQIVRLSERAATCNGVIMSYNPQSAHTTYTVRQKPTLNSIWQLLRRRKTV